MHAGAIFGKKGCVNSLLTPSLLLSFIPSYVFYLSPSSKESFSDCATIKVSADVCQFNVQITETKYSTFSKYTPYRGYVSADKSKYVQYCAHVFWQVLKK
ncbi:hypothetical protein AMECASPLE_025702 [Ameca splendens]|uniref:Uncharacterized protein n=1 Tax=Ameca splendens TaxID=208324 RepID=A0ABV0ZQI6_9TELE